MFKSLCRPLFSSTALLLSPVLLTSSVLAQVNGLGPSLSSEFDVVVNLPGDETIITGDFNESIGGVNGQTAQLNVASEGRIGTSFDANSGSEVNISGGTVGSGFAANSGSEVNISGGDFSAGFDANLGSVVNISGGSIFNFRADGGSEANVSGGSVDINAETGSVVNISGGNVSNRLTADPGSDVELIGGEFRLNGVEFRGGTISLVDDDVFTGTLADGSPFIFSNFQDTLNDVTLTVVELPPIDTNPIVVNTPVINGLSGLRAGQELTVVEGGSLGRSFELVDATLNVDGGNVGIFAEAYNSVVNISGGTVGIGFDAEAESEVNITGGIVGDSFTARLGSEVNISGGATVSLRALSGSDVELIGGEFRLNGTDFTGGTISLTDDDVFTGTLADGSSFIYSGFRDLLNDVTLTVVNLPPIDTDSIVVNTPVIGGPLGLRTGQEVTVVEGGSLGDSFSIVDATLNLEGGTLGNFAEVSNSVVNISGGTVGLGFDTLADSQINISGGTLEGNFAANRGSEVNVSGGTVGFGFDAFSGSVVNLTGGNVEGIFRAFSDSEVNIAGGRVGFNFIAFSGSVVNFTGGALGVDFNACAGSAVNIRGSEFSIDGTPLNNLQSGQPFTITDRDFRLAGVLANGEPFSFLITSDESSLFNYISPDATLTVTLEVPFLLGDVNRDGFVNFLDISAFIAVLSSGEDQAEADINQNGDVNFLDISPFIQVLIGSPTVLGF